MPLKIAVSGKGGVGKTTVAALLASQYARDGMNVVAVDADPASSLPAPRVLGIEEGHRSLSEMLPSRNDRWPGESYGSMFSSTPRWTTW